MAKPYLISLVGTKDDLLDLREVIKEYLTEKGYSVLAFDEADYPYMPGKDPGEYSVALASHPDVLILILDRWYGSRLTNKLSITENEWRNAEKSHVPVVACIRKRAIEEFKQWKAAGKKRKPSYVDRIDLLKLIELVRAKIYCLEFDNAVDLTAKLDEKMKSLTPFILKRVANATRKIASSKRTVTVIEQYLSLGDIFDKNLYVTPPYRMASGKLPGLSLEEDVVTCLQLRHNMIITGGPGTGKSTVLLKSLYQRSINMRDNPLLIPLYVDCRFLSSADFSTITSLLSRLFELAISKQIWPHFDPSDPNIEIEMFFDAIDEVRDGIVSFQQVIATSPIWSWGHHLIACRKDFLSRALNDPAISGRYQYIAELQPWAEEHIRLYVERKFASDLKKAEEILKTIQGSNTFRDLATNVIGLVMLCSLDDMSQVENPATLYQEFLLKWIVREAQRANIPMDDSEIILSTWRRVAWHILTSGRVGGVGTSQLPDIFERYDGRREVVKSPIIQSLFETALSGERTVVAGFIHASIYEYLLAAELVERLQGPLHQSEEALEQDTWYEVNEFTQQLTSKWKEVDCAEVAKNLIDAYERHMNDNRPEGLLLRNKACYYIGRLGRQSLSESSDAFSFLNKVWQEETSAFVRQSIGFARSIAGIPDAAKAFINEMCNNDELDSLNRGYHLAYYGDIKGQSPPYSDSKQYPFRQTRQALVARFSHDSEAKRNSRPVDLYTFRRFLQNRGDKPTTEEMKAIKNIIDNLDSYQDEVRLIIERECKGIIE